MSKTKNIHLTSKYESNQLNSQWNKFIYNICIKVNQQEIKSALVLTRDVTLEFP